MTDGTAILRAILDEPDDLTHRLVYADWLEEHGTTPLDAARAELIRVQIAREQADEDGEEYWTLRARERVLLATWGKALAQPLTDSVRFWRGFPEEVRLSAAAFNRTHRDLARLAPVRHAHLMNDAALTDAAVACLRGLDLIYPPGATRLWLPESRQLAGLESLGLELSGQHRDLTEAGEDLCPEVRCLFEAPPPRLRSLRLVAPEILWGDGASVERLSCLG